MCLCPSMCVPYSRCLLCPSFAFLSFMFLSFANFFFHIDTLCPPLSSYYVHYCMLSIYLSLKTPTNGLYLSISIVVNLFCSPLMYTKLVYSRYITFILIYWMLQKYIHSSDTVFHPAGWSSNLQGDDIILTELS